MTFQIENAKKITPSKKSMDFFNEYLKEFPNSIRVDLTSTLVASKHQNTNEWEFFSTGHLLECPNCSKYGVDDETLVCIECKEEFSEDDVCSNCDKLMAGSCYYCKMD